MKYFTKELWQGINDCDETVRRRSEELWSANDKLYSEEFQKIKGYFSSRFLREYYGRQGFHDCVFSKISFEMSGRKYCCEIQLQDGEEVVCITMTGIKKTKIDVESLNNCIQGKLTWGYSEFQVIDEKIISLSILCDFCNELQFEFETIKIKIM